MTPIGMMLTGIVSIFAVALWWYWRGFKARSLDKPLFLTYTPHAFTIGSVHDGNRITMIERVAPTALASGGVAPCWRSRWRSESLECLGS